MATACAFVVIVRAQARRIRSGMMARSFAIDRPLLVGEGISQAARFERRGEARYADA